ncbi:hypothetical protein GGX14DRAFT_392398 [Mycena pura]|uniref:Uncharacterized protein n=1 Tax=Mycena pura TaxID=153505 RepID=A0AAD6VMW1_9AGAR|nr:hypothetical protein GGX14DRAFT_392398 [Mycena pura]
MVCHVAGGKVAEGKKGKPKPSAAEEDEDSDSEFEEEDDDFEDGPAGLDPIAPDVGESAEPQDARADTSFKFDAPEFKAFDSHQRRATRESREEECILGLRDATREGIGAAQSERLPDMDTITDRIPGCSRSVVASRHVIAAAAAPKRTAAGGYGHAY